jgi:hypothetical protein
MGGIIKRVGKRLAGQPSRRGFIATLGRVAVGAAAVATGQDLAQQTEAAEPLQCCTGTPCSTTAPNTGPCPTGTTPYYTWYCAQKGGAGNRGMVHYYCTDCLYPNINVYACTYYGVRSGH